MSRTASEWPSWEGILSFIHSGGVQVWRLAIGRFVLLGALLLLIVARGGVTAPVLLLAAVAVALAAAIGAIVPPSEPRAKTSFYLALAIAAVLALYLIFQASSAAGNLLANPIWERSRNLIGPTQAAISVDPATTRAAIFPLVVPFLFYAAALSLYPSDEGGMKLLRWLVVIGVAFALFGILQVTWLTDSLLLSEKTQYLDSLTSVFVNRNTAGTLLGVASFAALTLALRPLRSEGPSRSLIALLTESDSPASLRRTSAVALVAVGILLVAMFMTRSRGALFSTVTAYVLVMPLLVLDGQKWDRKRSRRRAGSELPQTGPGWPLALLLGGVAFLLGLFALFGGLAINRMESRGIDVARLCVYRNTLRAFWDNWTFGTGFGTFSVVFPAYRGADCAMPNDVFLRAHNVYLEGLLGLGLPFVLLLLVLVLHVGGNLRRGVRTRQRLRFVPIVASGAVLLVALHSLVDFSLQIPGMAAYFATYLGAVTTVSLGRAKGGGPRRY